jgi:hypothetical protein
MYAPAVLESKTRVTTDQDVGRKAITRYGVSVPNLHIITSDFP